MEYPVIDPGTEEELLKRIEKKAKSFTPEWRLDRENPDGGTALALVFAKLHARTMGQFNRILQKHQIEFFNRLHAFMRSSFPAEGYVAFELVNDSVEGVCLPAGTALTTDTDGKGGEKVSAETLDEVFVTPVKIHKIFESCGSPDHIGRLNPPFSMFGLSGENLAEHMCSFSHPVLFSIRRSGRIGLLFAGRGGGRLSGDQLNRLADRDSVEIAYSTENGFQSFDRRYVENGILYLEKEPGQPAAGTLEMGGIDQCWIRMKLLHFTGAGSLEFCDLRLVGNGPSMAPDYVETDGGDQGNDVLMPFGERFGLYSEVYFASEEALSKKGAWITFSFREAFAEAPVKERDRPEEIRWKLVMPRSAVEVEQEYDITIGEVAWEYYNGRGWARLFPGKENSDVFGVEEGTENRRRTLVFLCPEDIQPAFWGSVDTYCIRARITRICNGFKTEGRYISPVISELGFQYEYPMPGERPDYFFCQNSMSEALFGAGSCLGQLHPFQPFWQNGDRTPAVYLGFAAPPQDGPVRMLWTVKNMETGRRPPLGWEYLSGGRWKELNPEDGTENLRRTGLVTFSGTRDWCRTSSFGEDLYWIRIRDLTGAYGPGSGAVPPVIGAIYMNASRARAIRSGYEEYVTLDHYQENFRHRLLYRNIHALEVWVDETDTCTWEEQEILRDEGRLLEAPDRSGMGGTVWVKWYRTASFYGSGRNSRHYILDANEGTVMFGDNRRGRIPAVGTAGGIHIMYSVGGGEETNLPPGGITGLEQSAGFIREAVSPLAFAGGYDQETVAEAVERSAGEIKHQFRAVTLRDFERLALEASGTIHKVRCVSGYDEKGKPASGHVSLVVLPKNQEAESHFFPELREQIFSYIRDKADPNLTASGKLHILEPVYVRIGIQADVYIEDYSKSYEIKSRLLRRLAAFLGSFPIGELPKREQILNEMGQDTKIRYLSNVIITYTIQEGEGGRETGRDEIVKNPYILASNGTHGILMRAGE